MSERTNASETMQILPMDGRGRVRVSRERRAVLLEQFDKSGMTVRRFAAWAGIKYQTLCGWLQRRKQAVVAGEPVASEAGDVRWVEAVVENNNLGQPQSRPPAARPGVLVIQLPGGGRMEIADQLAAALAGEVLRSLSMRQPEGGGGAC